MAKRIKYDKDYVEDIKHFKDKACKHESTAVYDGRFKGEFPTEMQMVCIRCGQISEWGKNKKGVFTCTFVKKG